MSNDPKINQQNVEIFARAWPGPYCILRLEYLTVRLARGMFLTAARWQWLMALYCTVTVRYYGTTQTSASLASTTVALLYLGELFEQFSLLRMIYHTVQTNKQNNEYS